MSKKDYASIIMSAAFASSIRSKDINKVMHLIKNCSTSVIEEIKNLVGSLLDSSKNINIEVAAKIVKLIEDKKAAYLFIGYFMDWSNLPSKAKLELIIDEIDNINSKSTIISISNKALPAVASIPKTNKSTFDVCRAINNGEDLFNSLINGDAKEAILILDCMTNDEFRYILSNVDFSDKNIDNTVKYILNSDIDRSTITKAYETIERIRSMFKNDDIKFAGIDYLINNYYMRVMAKLEDELGKTDPKDAIPLPAKVIDTAFVDNKPAPNNAVNNVTTPIPIHNEEQPIAAKEVKKPEPSKETPQQSKKNMVNIIKKEGESGVHVNVSPVPNKPNEKKVKVGIKSGNAPTIVEGCTDNNETESKDPISPWIKLAEKLGWTIDQLNTDYTNWYNWKISTGQVSFNFPAEYAMTIHNIDLSKL